jgi:hypothetical protein
VKTVVALLAALVLAAPVLAAPNSRIVRVCGRAFVRASQREPLEGLAAR